MDTILKILGIAIICAVAGVVVRSAGKDMGDIIKVISAAALSGVVLLYASSLFEKIFDIAASSQVNTYLSIMLKALGVAYLTHICASVCRDCGESTVAGYAELAGKIEMLLIATPLIEQIISVAKSLVEII